MSIATPPTPEQEKGSWQVTIYDHRSGTLNEAVFVDKAEAQKAVNAIVRDHGLSNMRTPHPVEVFESVDMLIASAPLSRPDLIESMVPLIEAKIHGDRRGPKTWGQIRSQKMTVQYAPPPGYVAGPYPVTNQHTDEDGSIRGDVSVPLADLAKLRETMKGKGFALGDNPPPPLVVPDEPVLQAARVVRWIPTGETIPEPVIASLKLIAGASTLDEAKTVALTTLLNIEERWPVDARPAFDFPKPTLDFAEVRRLREDLIELADPKNCEPSEAVEFYERCRKVCEFLMHIDQEGVAARG